MKICQEQKKQKLNKADKKLFFFNKKIVPISVFGCLIFILMGSILLQPGLVKGATPVQTQDMTLLKQQKEAKIEDAKNWWEKFTWEKALEEAWAQGAVLYKRALSYFLNQLAFDTATKLATGDWGQDPLIEHRTFKDVFRDAADNAAGYFIEDLGKQGFGGVKFNLCEPDFAIKYKITLGLQKWQKPPKPECTFSQMKENWEEELRDPDFLPKFQNSFNPWENDLGIALSLQTGLGSEVDKKANEAGLEKLANQGFKPVTDKISGFIKTPANVVRDFTKNTIEKSSSDYFVYTGYALADALDVFINTLLGTLMEEWLSEGIVTDFPESKIWEYDYDGSGLADFETGTDQGGIAAAKKRFGELIEPEFGVRGDYNILLELTICPDPTKAGPTNCVITNSFSEAILNKMTVARAIEQGYLNQDGIFGFDANGLELNYLEAYPYRSMLILRKFRIIPIGWELAAQYIKEDPTATGQCNLGDLVACFDPGDEYAYASQNCNQGAWCRGLVDPFWVLKSPLNYCAREGYGPEILHQDITGEGDSSALAISRNDNYCADEQTCIQENDDGSCLAYGYCAEERRRWRFDGDSCEPKYNTCQTFRSGAGKTASYLENTLDYSGCSIDNAGCKQYCTDYDFANSSWNCTLATVGDKLYADKNIEECDQDEEGCYEFIRTKAGLGANLLKNSSFEYDLNNWGVIINGASSEIEVDSTESLNNAKSLKIYYDGTSGCCSSVTQTIEGIMPNEQITVSYYVKSDLINGWHKGAWLVVYARDALNANIIDPDSGTGWIGNSVLKEDYNGEGVWKRIEFSFITPSNTAKLIIQPRIQNPSGTAYFDAIKVERGGITNYSDYREDGLIYQKLAPDYLGCNNPSPPLECDNFVRKCNQIEVGCELYTSATDNMSIPARVIARDYCPAECAGYDAYIQAETIFDSLRPAYFIPDTVRTCRAEAAGCDEFTNLDEVAQGGEGIEYYSYLRQCIEPSDPIANCAEFYTWEGSDETGYQLKTHSLEEDIIENDPEVTSDDSAECNSLIYALPATDPGYNPDCREFYNTSAVIFYHLYTRTISCDEDCHPYRRTENNIDTVLLSAADCTPAGSGYSNTAADQFSWDGVNNVCYFCRSRGEWSNEHQACIYMAVPNQGIRCSSGQSGCREYSGNAGNNMKIVLNNDFEGSLGGWIGISGAVAELSSTALIAGGESLHVYNADFKISTTVGNLVQENKSYVLSFLAMPSGANQINSIKLVNGAGDEADFIAAPLALSSNWQLYKVNLAVLGHDVSDSESLVIEANGDFYIDNIRLTEIIDRYYLIKNSWATPDSCYRDIMGNYKGPTYNLGCDEYRDRDNNRHYLYSFDWLCDDSAVGCEIMIDTHNYSDYNSQTFNSGDLSEIVIPNDSFIYVVYDRNKKCNSQDKGCERLGRPYKYESSVLYKDVYLKNNPDKYNEILCLGDEAGCEEWSTSDGTAYFKDPGGQICEWRQAVGVVAGSWGWYKNKVKRCDDNGDGAIGAGETAVCMDDNSCASGISCILDNADYACSVDISMGQMPKTFGFGGADNAVNQPTYDAHGYWIGLCSAAQAGCTEYIDPVSRFSTNTLFNGDFIQDANPSDGVPDGWSASANGVQIIPLEANILYILAVEGNNTAIISTAGNDFYELGSNNNLISPVNSIIVSSAAGSRASKRFYVSIDISADVTVNNSAVNNGSTVEVKQVVIDYQLKQDVNKADCNGIVNFEDGCVLFNERRQNGLSKAILDYDADLTVDDGIGIVPDIGMAAERDSNALLKVSPDRACNKWLGCKDIEVVPGPGNTDTSVCNEMGVCSRLDDNGNCDRWVSVNKVSQTYAVNIGLSSIANMSGYVKVGHDIIAPPYPNNNWLYPNDYYPLVLADTVGQGASVANSGFEDDDLSVPPPYWECSASACKVVYSPVEMQDIGACAGMQAGGLANICTKYAPEGRNILSLLAGEWAETANLAQAGEPAHYIQVAGGTDYILTAYIGTTRLTVGEARIIIKQYDNAMALTGSHMIILNRMEPWTFKLNSFTTAAATTQIKIILTSYDIDGFSSVAGNLVFFDGIKIRPALESGNNWYTPQTCRLYPRNNALSCDYYDDTGIRYKGVSGYCLEYDRYPGIAEACLMWWSIPNVDLTAGGLDEFCGDGNITGDEDCDCGLDNNDNVILTCPNPYSSDADSRYNQYSCIFCRWAEGWCGDNVAQFAQGERCDCGDNIPPGNSNLTCDWIGINSESVCDVDCMWDDCEFGGSPNTLLPCVFGTVGPSTGVIGDSNSGQPN